MKKLMISLMSLLLVFSIAGCKKEEGPKEDNTLIVYTSTASNILEILEPKAEEATGLDITYISLPSAECYERVVAERKDPQADVFAAGGPAEVNQDLSLFMQYYSSHNDEVDPAYRSKDGYSYIDGGNTSVIIYNTDLCPFEITGYQDLLDPRLKGHIAMGNALASNSAYYQLENMLVCFAKEAGKFDNVDDLGWDFVKQFYENLDGKIIDSSSAVYKGVVSGEYWVACTYDTGAMNALTLAGEAGSHVKIVLMKEGVVTKLGGGAIIANCKHPENAKKYVEYITSKEWAQIQATIPGCMSIRTDIEIPDYNNIGLTADTKIIDCDSLWTAAHKPEVVAKLQALLEEINFGS
ncbi:MAG: extracellular solute-binding protein [Erysipelotrichaceae bacterium]|nr:extracellular solute-binding protein [Erysipelotrichaceae bacterium]